MPGTYDYFKKLMMTVTRHYPELEIIEMNHDRDHVHIFMSIPPKMSVGSVVRIIKSNTGRKMKSKFIFLQKIYRGGSGIWSSGYFVSTTGINEEIIKNYIKHQGKEDCGQAELEF